MERKSDDVGNPKKATGDDGHSTGKPGKDSVVLCRNRHWSYISSFHGRWLNLSLEILESVAHVNYKTTPPSPIHSGFLYDIYKIRRHVDEATHMTMRAALGLPSCALAEVNSNSPAYSQTRELSSEQRHRLRKKAVQHLAAAYRMDEIATSVLTMRGATAIEDVARIVLQRSPEDVDAQYVHFFHEKISSKQLADSDSLKMLDHVILQQPGNLEALRTRSVVRMLKEDHQAAVNDLTVAIQALRGRAHHHHPEAPQGSTAATPKRRQDTLPAEAEQPNSLGIQLLFQRAGAYLTLACVEIAKVLPPDILDPHSTIESSTEPVTSIDRNPNAGQVAAQKAVRTYAKRALRDYLALFSHFEYSPNVTAADHKDFGRRLTKTITRGPPTSYLSATEQDANESHSAASLPGPSVYTMDQLFSSSPPRDVPAFPPRSFLAVEEDPVERISYHPLVTDAIHAVLIVHAILQTPPTELRRYALMAARLARIMYGFPIFEASKSPARSDWVEVLHRVGKKWLKLPDSWRNLCDPTAQLGSDSSSSLEKSKKPPVDGIVDCVTGHDNRTSVSNAGRKSMSEAQAAAERQAEEDLLIAAGQSGAASYTAGASGTRVPSWMAAWVPERPAEGSDDKHKSSIIEESGKSRRAAEGLSSSFPSSSRTPSRRRDEKSFKPTKESKATFMNHNEPALSVISKVANTEPQEVYTDYRNSQSMMQGPAAEDGSASAHVMSDGQVKEYAILTARANCVAKWVLFAPALGSASTSTGGKRRKKGGKKTGLAKEASIGSVPEGDNDADGEALGS